MVVDKKKKRKAIRKRSVVKPRRTKRQASGTKISIRINTADAKRHLPPASRAELITSYVSGETRLKTDVERLFQGEPSNVLIPFKKPLPTPAVATPPLEAKTPPIPPAPEFKAPAAEAEPEIQFKEPAKQTRAKRTPVKKPPQKIGKAIDISDVASTDTSVSPVKAKRGRKAKVEFIGASPSAEGVQF